MKWDLLQKVKSKYSGLLRFVFRRCFLQPINFKTGFLVKSALGGEFLVRARLGLVIQDEKAFKEMKLVFGASGNKCCSSCKNIYQGDESKIEGNEFVRHYKKALPHQFVQHTDASAWEMVDKLAAFSTTANKTDMAVKEQ
eukprot:7299206-Pyramimonas_sp.AAC.1